MNNTNSCIIYLGQGYFCPQEGSSYTITINEVNHATNYVNADISLKHGESLQDRFASNFPNSRSYQIFPLWEEHSTKYEGLKSDLLQIRWWLNFLNINASLKYFNLEISDQNDNISFQYNTIFQGIGYFPTWNDTTWNSEPYFTYYVSSDTAKYDKNTGTLLEGYRNRIEETPALNLYDVRKFHIRLSSEDFHYIEFSILSIILILFLHGVFSVIDYLPIYKPQFYLENGENAKNINLDRYIDRSFQGRFKSGEVLHLPNDESFVISTNIDFYKFLNE